jgi:hypothetical protein
MHPREENIIIIPGRLRQFNTKELVKKLKLNTITTDIQYLTLTL